MKKSRMVLLVIIMVFAGMNNVSATQIYLENFEDASPAIDAPVSTSGWSSVSTDGTTLTDRAGDPSRIVNNTQLEGNYRTFMGSSSALSQWLTTDEVDFNPAQWDDLEISMQHFNTDNDSGVGDGYRFAFKTAGTWYLQDSLMPALPGAATTSTQIISSLNFIAWTGAPIDDSTAWSVPATGGGTNLPTGIITGLGLMLVQNHSDDKFRFDDIQINGTPRTNLFYTENFEIATPPASDLAVSMAGWTSVSTDGTTLTDRAGDPSRIVNNTQLEGNYRTYMGKGTALSQWLTTDEVLIDQEARANIVVSFQYYDTKSTNAGYRIAFQIDNNWYIQDSLIIGPLEETVTTTQTVASLDFIKWTSAPVNDSSTWSVPATGGGSRLPSGMITGLGLMLVQDSISDIFRFDNIQITTTIRPPSGTVIVIQ